jgi:hypothetical protein
VTRPEPDLAGYREAHTTLVAKLGNTVPFFIPVEEQYAPGTVLDPETNRPYDPTIEPMASGFASAAVKCGVAIRSVGLSRRGTDDDSKLTALGVVEVGQGILIVPVEDFDGNELDEATECEVHSERYEITQTDRDGIGEEVHRVLVYIQQL